MTTLMNSRTYELRDYYFAVVADAQNLAWNVIQLARRQDFDGPELGL